MHAVDTMFLFLNPEVDAAGRRVERSTSAGPTAFVWVPDADAAARIAGSQAAAGVRLVELYGGFALEQAGQVVEAIAGRAPVGLAVGPANRIPGDSVMIFGDDSGAGALVVEHGVTRTTVVGVPDEDAAVRAAVDAVEAGTDTVEICGGTPLTTAARVASTVGDRASVTLVSWPFESLEGAAAYKAAFEATH
ncbi:DUF6506 family protein [Pseudonocardia sp. MH-G8]|uniref:DUF6506 family protein n=1 Tax=Pseudonocardia sp. MH-G8 TaxID=1854588 RepID=UPI000BA0BE88|nr:DUF6506 family protein [Pseudonocardia sp. MH-G8]OZM77746.1 hypothetical protein CFP66_33815 [Pseudonocardia sp. MH-G8]